MALIQDVMMSKIALDPKNPRKAVDEKKILELANSIETQGLIQPITVRLKEGKYLVVVGERRFRAHQLLNKDFIHAEIKEMSDREAMEYALSENINREDMHPLEECDAFINLIDEHGKSPEDIANMLGKSLTFVYKRIKLKDLTEKARNLFLEGKLTITHCLELIKISPENQDKCLKAMMGIDHHDNSYVKFTAKEMEVFIANNVEVSLSTACFKTNDMKLVPEAGPCSTCQFRSGYNKMLFNDVESDDICYNPECFNKKTMAHIEVMKQKEIKKGNRVVEISTHNYIYDRTIKESGVLSSNDWDEVPEDHKCNQPESCIAVGIVVHGDGLGMKKIISIHPDSECSCLDDLHYDYDLEKYTREKPEEDEDDLNVTFGEEEETQREEEFKDECKLKYAAFKTKRELQFRMDTGVLPGLANNKMLDLIIAMYVEYMDQDIFVEIMKPLISTDQYNELEEMRDGENNAKFIVEYLSGTESNSQRCELLMRLVVNDVQDKIKFTYSPDGPDYMQMLCAIFEINTEVSEKDFKLVWDKFKALPESTFQIVDEADFFDLITGRQAHTVTLEDMENLCKSFEIELPEKEDMHNPLHRTQYKEALRKTIIEHFAV